MHLSGAKRVCSFSWACVVCCIHTVHVICTFSSNLNNCFVLVVILYTYKLGSCFNMFKKKRKSGSDSSASDSEPLLKKSNSDSTSASNSSCDYSDEISEEVEEDGKFHFSFTFTFHT